MNSHYLAGMSFNQNVQKIIAWYNNQPYHTMPLSLYLTHNAMVKSMLGQEHSIHVSNYPLPFQVESTIDMSNASYRIGFQLATNLSFAMSFIATFYILFLIKERVSNAKHLQMVSGVNVATFWISSYLVDFVTFTFTVVLLILALLFFQEDGWKTIDDVEPVFVIFIAFVFATLSIIYLSSLVFATPALGFTKMTIFFIFTGKFQHLIR